MSMSTSTLFILFWRRANVAHVRDQQASSGHHQTSICNTWCRRHTFRVMLKHALLPQQRSHTHTDTHCTNTHCKTVTVSQCRPRPPPHYLSIRRRGRCRLKSCTAHSQKVQADSPSNGSWLKMIYVRGEDGRTMQALLSNSSNVVWRKACWVNAQQVLRHDGWNHCCDSYPQAAWLRITPRYLISDLTATRRHCLLWLSK